MKRAQPAKDIHYASYEAAFSELNPTIAAIPPPLPTHGLSGLATPPIELFQFYFSPFGLAHTEASDSAVKLTPCRRWPGC